MFPDSDGPRLFGLPPGVDFADRVIAGLDRLTGGIGPEALARVTLYVNTRRMQRRMRALFDAGPPRLLPRIRLVTDLAFDPVSADIPPPVAPLRRKLELSQLVAQLLDREPDLAPRAALFDLSESLARLMAEMQGEGVPPETIAQLDVTDLSGHWARAQRFFDIVRRYFDNPSEPPDQEARQRLVVERLAANWLANPPSDPVIVAGSTGSRGTTALFMQAVARLPQGAVILPGFDFDMPQAVWDRLDSVLTAEDHPQYRFRRIMQALGLKAGDVRPWDTAAPPNAARNRLVSLSLRPAPVTDQWRTEGPGLRDLDLATRDLTLLEAVSPRAEAETIALRLRHAVDEGRTAALITPDRMLTRQVAAALDRWNITPDDSAGLPLPLSPPGRLLRQVADLFGRPLTATALLALLKHPLVHGGADRGLHLLRTRELELHLRRNGPPFPVADTFVRWAEKTAGADRGRIDWAGWLATTLCDLDPTPVRPLCDHVTAHLALAERLSDGPEGRGGLWDEAAGRVAKQVCDTLVLHADAGGPLSATDYAALFGAVLAGAEVRDRDTGHPQVLFRGTLEARVQGADLIILGGMNEGVWPEAPAADPWLNRTMRAQAGLLLPERRIGLSAHDYMQAVAGAEVWITRAVRGDEAQTVPSRWINRLCNLLGGLEDTGGKAALAAMRERGQGWAARAAALSAPQTVTDKAKRPSPRPHPDHRPKTLSVTRIKTLIRDPYAIYAEYILGLRPLDPLSQTPDALLRGTVLHEVFERFIDLRLPPDAAGTRAALIATAAEVLEARCPWPTVQRIWLARIDKVADDFLRDEVGRQALGVPRHLEIRGALPLDDLGFTLTAKADRIDIAAEGVVNLYDYKTGKPPTGKQQARIDKQLLLEAAMVSRGAFPAIGAATVAEAAYIGLGAPPAVVPAPLADHPPARVLDELRSLIAQWQVVTRGYSARMTMEKDADTSDYDHLSRFGEWELGDDVAPETMPGGPA